MKKIFIIMIAAALAVMTASAQDIKAHRGEVKNGYNFWLSTPRSVVEGDKADKPLVVFLHGSSLCGTDLNKVMRYGTLKAVKDGLDLDAYVLAPQNPGGAWKPENVMNIIDYVIDELAYIDDTRVYLIGMSLGGQGTINVAEAYPDRIAAAMSMCGGGVRRDFSSLNQVPLWIVHGTADASVSVAKSDHVVKTMKAADPTTPRLIYSRVPGLDHSKPCRLMYLPEVYEWLFSHCLDDEDRAVTEGFAIDMNLINNARSQRDYSRTVSVNLLDDVNKRGLGKTRVLSIL